MRFQIYALPAERFASLFGQDDAVLARLGAERCRADAAPGYPCRVSLADAEPGDSMLLLNFEHQPAATPYRACHAIYVREWATQANPRPDEIPEALRRRVLSVRGFDFGGRLIRSGLSEGKNVARTVQDLLDDPRINYLHLHYAAPGCYAARVERAATA